MHYKPHGSFDQRNLIRRGSNKNFFHLQLGKHPVNTVHLVQKSFLRARLLYLHCVAQTQSPQEQLLLLLTDKEMKRC